MVYPLKDYTAHLLSRRLLSLTAGLEVNSRARNLASQHPKPSSHLEASPVPQALTGRALGKGGVPGQLVLSREVPTGLAHCLGPAQARVTLTGEQAAAPVLIGYGGAAFLPERLRTAGRPASRSPARGGGVSRWPSSLPAAKPQELVSLPRYLRASGDTAWALAPTGSEGER